MGGISIYSVMLVTVLAPLLLTVFSKRTKGAAKLGWAILVIVFSWVGYAIFLIATTYLNKNSNQQA
ncbi:hypothetical protein [Shewanella dokdonensis]|uniref:Cardiolipin synthase N-terminal domain-containing protein n=1 Tax=Shewanella dokdonensis TaxID=712036 RepID=A0ABX8DDH8_9GAMM|nr:hypothetical protein [Shewanella dokdonensis]MCL1074738.1 hypothetical protein [Shewanella dokdonensis]QVK22281.1 hypothetical protein KHX94_12755 [Shewanella dokdonensis]